MDKNKRFWDFLLDTENADIRRIEIPVIQRGYAQGRASAKNIRNDFLKALRRNMEPDRKLHLDFVYGTTDNGIFEPLDGQQRLTTLFLLHWYLACLDGRDESKTLEKFSYQTRNSSERFCNELARFCFGTLKSEDRLSKIIAKQAWFATAWKKDSTVAAMLVMLDDIHKLFFNLKGKSAFETLSKSDKITFNLIKLDDYGLTDDLYIKMNARGKPLTPFEIFKSALDKKLFAFKDKGMTQAEINDFSKSIDGKWLDLFFSMDEAHKANASPKSVAKTKKGSFDNLILAFFVRVLEFASLENLCKKTDADCADTYKKLQEKRAEIVPCGDSDGFGGKFPFEFYEKMSGASAETIIGAKRFLDRLADKSMFKYEDSELKKGYLTKGGKPLNPLFDENAVIQRVLTDNGHYYIEALKFYGSYKYLSREKVVDTEAYEKWMRIVSNIAETVIYNNQDDFAPEFLRINALVEHADYIEEYLAKESVETKDKHQVEWDEERLKASILHIDSGGEWRKLIYRAERDNGYLRGGINFLFKFCSLSRDNIDECDDYKNSFKDYLLKTEAVFGENGFLNSNRETGDLFRRTLLTYGDYSLSRGRNQNLLTLSGHRDTKFTKFLKQESTNLKKLFDEKAKFDKLLLENIITRELPRIAGQKDAWREGFIKHPEFLSTDCCEQYNFRINDWDAGGAVVLKGIQKTGKWWGYHALWFYYELTGKNGDYAALDTVEVARKDLSGHKKLDDCAITLFDKKNGKKIAVSFDNEKWNIRENARIVSYGGMQEVLDDLTAQNWVVKR